VKGGGSVFSDLAVNASRQKEDEEGGRMWLDKASNLGDPDALYALGAEKHAGGGQVEEGEKMLVKASQLGHADAAYYLSMIAREKGILSVSNAKSLSRPPLDCKYTR